VLRCCFVGWRRGWTRFTLALGIVEVSTRWFSRFVRGLLNELRAVTSGAERDRVRTLSGAIS